MWVQFGAMLVWFGRGHSKPLSPTDLFMVEFQRRLIEKVILLVVCAFTCVLLLLHSISWSVPARCCKPAWPTALCKCGLKTHSSLFFPSSILLKFCYLFPPRFLYLRRLCAFYFTFFFKLRWQCATQRIKIESTLIPFFLFTPLHLVIFFTAFRRRFCFVCKTSLAGSELRCNLRNILFSNVVIMQCHFRVPLVHILNCVQTVPSCSFCYYCVTNKVESYCWYFAAVWEDLYRVGLHFNLLIQLCHWAQLHMHYLLLWSFDRELRCIFYFYRVFCFYVVVPLLSLWLGPGGFFWGCLLPSFFVTFPFSACAP